MIKTYKFDMQLPDRKASDLMNQSIISNLLFDNDLVDQKAFEERENIIKLNKFIQMPYEKSTQTDILDKETQRL